MKLVLNENDIKKAVTMWIEETVEGALINEVTLADDEGGWQAVVTLKDY